jgi:tRNA1(Val) A37 N6-methylase TrmN6
LLVEDYHDGTIDLKHSFNHSCSWTSIIDTSLSFVTDYLGPDSRSFSFVDIGCGKGKVLLMATKKGFLKKFLNFYGVEINPQLVEIANRNFEIMKLPACKIYTESAKTLDLGKTNKNLVSLYI